MALQGMSTAADHNHTSAHTTLAAAKPMRPCKNRLVDTAEELTPLEGVTGWAAAQANHKSLPVLLACNRSNQMWWQCDMTPLICHHGSH